MHSQENRVTYRTSWGKHRDAMLLRDAEAPCWLVQEQPSYCSIPLASYYRACPHKSNACYSSLYNQLVSIAMSPSSSGAAGRSASSIADSSVSTSGETTNRRLTSPRTCTRLCSASTCTACCRNEGCVAAVTCRSDRRLGLGFGREGGGQEKRTSMRIPFARRILTAPLA